MGALYRWVYLVSLTFFPTLIFSAPVTYETVRVGAGAFVTSGIKTPITAKIAVNGAAIYHEVAPIVNKPAFRKLALFVGRRTPQGIAAMALIDALGYIFNPDTGEIEPATESHPGVFCENECFYAPHNSGTIFSSSPLAAASMKLFDRGFQTQSCSVIDSLGNVSCVGIRTDGYTVTQNSQYRDTGIDHSCPSGQVYHSSDGCIIDTQWSLVAPSSGPVDLNDVDNALADGLSESQKREIIRYSVIQASPGGSFSTDDYPVSVSGSTGSQVQVLNAWPELAQALQNAINAEIAAYKASLDPTDTPSPDEQEIVDSGTTAPPLTEVEWPSFCTWAAWLCELPVLAEQPEVPTLDLEAPSYDSGLPGNASCPAPVQVVTGFGTWQITFQFACDLATALRTPLIAITYLMSAFIVVGVRK